MEKYFLYLNDTIYGHGDLKYVHELIHNYVIIKELYGKEQVDFIIVKANENLMPSRIGYL